MSEKEPTKFDEEMLDIRHEHEVVSSGLQLARQLRVMGETGRSRLRQNVEGHREAIRQLNLTEEEKAAHLDHMTPEIIEAEFPGQEKEEVEFLHNRTKDYTDNIARSQKHYEKHKDRYIDTALQEATEAGVPIMLENAHNLESITDPKKIHPLLTENELAHLQSMTERTGFDYLPLFVKALDKKTSGEDIEKDRAIIQDSIRVFEVHTHVLQAMEEKHANPEYGERQLRLYDVPLLQENLERLGFDEATQKALFESWNSYQPIKRAMRSSGAKHLNEEIIRTASERMAGYVAVEFEAMQDFISEYGVERAQTVILEFGIHHFRRYEAKQLAMQLVIWQANLVPIENVVASAHSDWNGAFQDAGSAMLDRFDGLPTVYFEVEDSTDLAHRLVSVGNRERAAGRDPEAGNFVNNLIIAGHGSPESILLGTHGESINVRGYKEAGTGRERVNAQINTFRRHLGSGFQVILDSCSTAGVNLGGRNIAKAISDEHDTLVHAVPVPSYNPSRHGEEGELIFRISPDAEWLEAARYDGRDGNGVTENSPFKTRLKRWAHFLHIR